MKVITEIESVNLSNGDRTRQFIPATGVSSGSQRSIMGDLEGFH